MGPDVATVRPRTQMGTKAIRRYQASPPWGPPRRGTSRTFCHETLTVSSSRSPPGGHLNYLRAKP